MSDFTATTSGSFPLQNSMDVDVVELQLQQELRSMFDADTQQYLQTYITLVQQLQADRWAADIQEIYRTIHTIKGGAVTVGANAILMVSTVLEDLLSDLRHLDVAPPLEDGVLSQILLEAGELLVGTTQAQGENDQAEAMVKPTVDRIQVLREQIQSTYLQGWSEHAMLHQEFAQQGFGLVILDLEIFVESLTPTSQLTQANLELAQQTLTQLAEIGSDLQFEAPWSQLLETCAQFTMGASAAQWILQWPLYFQALKQSAYGGGQAIDLAAFGIVEPLAPTASLDRTGAMEALSVSGEDDPADLAADALSLALEADAVPPAIDHSLEQIGIDDSQMAEEDSLEDAIATLEGLDLEDLAIEELEDLEDVMFSESSAAIGMLDDFAIEDLNASLETLEPTQETAAQLTEAAAEPAPAPELGMVDLEALELDVPPEVLEDEPQVAAMAATPSETLEPSEAEPDLAPLVAEAEPFVPDESLDALSDAMMVLEDLDVDSLLDATQTAAADLADLQAPIPMEDEELLPSDSEAWLGLVATTPTAKAAVPEPGPAPTPAQPRRRVTKDPSDIRIPVPLGRLDRGAQYLVDSLLNARASHVSFRTLQSQLTQLLSLAQESAQYITRLRQIQDDYALLDELDSQRSSTDEVALERYQQGYTTINRLLENSLRLSELGVEAEKTVFQTADSLQSLDHTMAQLQQNIEQSRLVPFKNLSFRAKAILRDLTNRLGKPAQLVVHGEQMDLDAGTLSRLEPVLLHLIRNALDHGLESQELRSQRQKPAQGTLTLLLRRRGNTFLLDVSDDGGGIDADKISQIAQSKGLPLTITTTPTDLLAVLCQSGFSSQSSVSDVSGRGVGMDVVAKQVEMLGGRLSLDTAVGAGTTCLSQFAVPHMLVPCIVIAVGNRTVALPTEDITTTNIIGNLQLTADNEAKHLYNWQVQQGDKQVPGWDLVQYWQPDAKTRSLSETALSIGVKHPDTGQMVWLLADDLREQTDLLINPLPSPMVAPQGLVGVTLLPDGRLVSVLEPAALAELVLEERVATAPTVNAATTTLSGTPTAATAATTITTRTILVVDDAALMRRRLEASLRAYGYETHACADGLDAWNWLQANSQPALVITDVEMPNMDGFTLIDRCRQAGMEMPMLVVSSRLAEEWSKEAKRLGATDYLTKGFSTPDLIAKVKSLMLQTVPSD